MIVDNKTNSHDERHGPIITDSSSGEILCGSCGLVLVEKVEDSGSESSTMDPGQYMANSRTGSRSTLTIHDRGLSTMIDSKNKDADGKPIFGQMKNTMSRLRLWDSHSKARSHDRTLRAAFLTLSTVKAKLDISDAVAERAAYFYRKAVSMRLTRGRNINALILSAIYAACREANVPRTLHDVASAGNINTKFLSRHFRLLVMELDLKLESFEPSDFVSKLASVSGLSQKTSRDALNILHKAKEKGIIAGKNPIAVAAATLYLSALINMEQKSQQKISDSCGISSVTVRNIATLLRTKLGINTN